MKALLVLCAGLAIAASAAASGLNWPTNRFLPTFSTPAASIDAINLASTTTAEQDLFASLEGIVNRTQPRIALVNPTVQEGEFTWLIVHNLPYSVLNGYSAVSKYLTNVTGLVVTDTNQPDTLNLATTIAGLKNELICDPSLLSTLTNSPYKLAIKDDLRGVFTNKYQVYQYLYSNYWPQCTHRIIAGMETNGHWNLRDYLVAVQAAVVWLDPGVAADAAALAPFISGMAPVGGVYMGWWPSEDNGLTWIAQYGIPVIASDWYENGSLFGGVASPINIPAIPPPPTLQNKIYVSITLSDGDNVQYMQHQMKAAWGSAGRGAVPIGWTSQPLSVDLDPAMLNYYWNTATTNDCLVAGPSGAGYTRLNYWNPAHIAAYTQASNPYLQRAGMTGITVWNTVSRGMANAYAANCPTLLGVNDQDDGYYVTNFETLPTIGFPGSANYAGAETNLIYGITNTAANWNGTAPMFLAVQGSGWVITPANCQTIAATLNTNYVIVRPDHLSMLYRQAVGMAQSGAPRIVGNLPSTLKVPAGFPLTLTVYAVGSQPLSNYWLFNGTNLTDGARVSGSQTAVLSVGPAGLGDAGQYQVVVSNASGSVTSAVCNATVGRNVLSAAAGWTANGNPATITNGSVTLTDGKGSESSSFFLDCPQYVGAFNASFTYQDVGGNGADGCAFVLQDSTGGAGALGGGGGQLGYGGITPSVAAEFNIYSSSGVGMAVRTNGATGAPYSGTGSVNLAGGHPIGVSLAYNGATLSITLTDAVTRATFTTNTALDIVGVLGTNTAFVGLTGADGGTSSTQIITNFQFASLTALSCLNTGSNSVVLTWPNSASGYVLQQEPSLGSKWTNMSDPVLPGANGSNQTVLPAPADAEFYRLATP